MSQFSAASLADVTPIEPRRSAGSLLLPACELLIVLGLVEFDLWYLRGSDSPLLHMILYAALGFVIWFSLQRRKRISTEAISKVRNARAWCESLTLTILATLFLLASAWVFRDRDEGLRFFFRHRPPWEWLVWISVRILGAAVQQLGLQFFIGPVCREVVRPGILAVCAAGLLFGVLHLPHPILVTITVIMGSFWVWLYGRSGRLAPVVVCHAILSVLAAGTLPKSVITDMDIGRLALNQMINPRYLYTEDVRDGVDLVRTNAYYTRQGGTPRGFIEGLYMDFLGREPTEQELDKWLIELSHNSRARTALSIFKSRNFERVRVREVAIRLSVLHEDEIARHDRGDSSRR